MIKRLKKLSDQNKEFEGLKEKIGKYWKLFEIQRLRKKAVREVNDLIDKVIDDEDIKMISETEPKELVEFLKSIGINAHFIDLKSSEEQAISDKKEIDDLNFRYEEPDAKKLGDFQINMN